MSAPLRSRIAAPAALAALTALVLPLRAVQAATEVHAPEVVGGTPVDVDHFPFLVSLQKVAGPGATSGSHFCGGTLVDPSWVLTAAHCMAGRSPSAFRVVVGPSRLSAGDGVVRAPSSVRVDPAWNGDPTHGGDIALVRLSSPVEGVAPVKPVGSDERDWWEPATAATVVGWGVTVESSSTPSDELRSARIPIQPDSVMSAAAAYGKGFLGSDMIGAGDLTGGADACYGDSGGPLLVRRGSGVRQIGIVSFGNGCGHAGFPGVYSRLGEGPVRAFADSVLTP